MLDVGHEGVITGRDGFSLRSSIANPQGVAQPPLQSLLSISPWGNCRFHTDKLSQNVAFLD
ncbi:hypothetical protein CWD94_29195 [Lysinibacillus xylanilyticus]|uniref:Uncharacterized protein n=1 Tax=Lysinibacillus xylanilyticus TaxID=582475 RepID=A0A2M9PWN2_9BACI|nr:hypothetical protein CWD94_29195 [Lysinibacillus xylanilyticus]